MIIKGKHCTSFFSKIRGEMFRKEIIPLIFHLDKECYVTLHSWFVLKPLLIIFVDKNLIINEIRRLNPWDILRSKNKSKYVVELPYKKSNFSIGEKMSFRKL